MNAQSRLQRFAEYLKRSPLTLFFIPFLIYVVNGREISNGDTTPAVMTAIHISAYGTIYLDHLHDFVQYNSLPYYVSEQKGHILSNYPVLPGIMAVPLAVPAYYSGMVREGEGDLTWRYLSKLSGSVYTALSVTLLFYALCYLVSPGASLVLAYAYGLCTALYPIASQSLWQHGTGLFWITLAVYAVMRAIHEDGAGRGKVFFNWLVIAGLAIGFSVCCRMTNMVAVAGVCGAALVLWRVRGVPACIAAALPVAVLLVSNYALFGNLQGGYVELYKHREAFDGVAGGTWSTPFLTGFFGQLISPSRGIFIFSPFLVFAFWGIGRLIKKRGSEWTFVACLVPVPLLLICIFSKYAVWWGGNSHYGPRYLIETYPFFILLIAAVWDRIEKQRPLFILFMILLLWSFAVQVVGAFGYPGDWAVKPVRLAEDHARLWDWSYNQVFDCFKTIFKN